MFTITEYQVEKVIDAFGIIAGERYEYIIDIALEEDDELYSEQGVYIRAIYGVNEDRGWIVKYDLYERTTNRYLDFDLEEDEEKQLAEFCSQHYKEHD